jgi:hypothetical protein
LRLIEGHDVDVNPVAFSCRARTGGARLAAADVPSSPPQHLQEVAVTAAHFVERATTSESFEAGGAVREGRIRKLLRKWLRDLRIAVRVLVVSGHIRGGDPRRSSDETASAAPDKSQWWDGEDVPGVGGPTQNAFGCILKREARFRWLDLTGLHAALTESPYHPRRNPSRGALAARAWCSRVDGSAVKHRFEARHAT